MSLIINDNAGFFACCNMRLSRIVDYINININIPKCVDSSNQFEWYKEKKKNDITFIYFADYNTMYNILYTSNINYNHNFQYKDYSTIDFNKINPLVYKYFSPSEDINNIIKNIEEKYNIIYNNICVLFYRGNDKNTETKICKYDEYIKYANIIINNNKNVKFLIQSDETEFIELMLKTYPDNSFYFKDEIRHMRKCNNTVDKVFKENILKYSKNFLAITIIMSKSKYIVCGSGNCSLWIVLYRGNSKNIYQNLNGKWIDHI